MILDKDLYSVREISSESYICYYFIKLFKSGSDS